MTLKELLRGLKVRRTVGRLDRDVQGIVYDSRHVKDGYLFVAIKGFSEDGHTYIKEAISRGCAGVVIENRLDLQTETAVIEVNDSRSALASLSSAFYKEPAKELSLIGITGTNGKTSTSYIIKSILETWGRKTGLIGTNNYIIGKKTIAASQTTPESLDLQRYLREMVEDEMKFAVIEVSSHALLLRRVEGCLFRVAVFTNFSQDHLDFHGTMKEYFSAKSRLFDYLGSDGYAVLNNDDSKIRKLSGKLDCNLITCGLEKGAMIRAEDVTEQTPSDSERIWTRGQASRLLKIITPEEEYVVETRLIGRNNIYNILMSIGTAYAIGVGKDAIVKGIREAEPVEGRFEKVDEGQDFMCIVDYAHTEDALKSLIQEARLITKGRVITVFGCGGDRDRTKRPAMGAAASDLSDIAIITSDNPRTEDPMKIINEILESVKDNFVIQPDRTEAIKQAVLMAGREDTVLIAGKGHEDYQEIMGVRHPFSDREVVKKAIKNYSSTGSLSRAKSRGKPKKKD